MRALKNVNFIREKFNNVLNNAIKRVQENFEKSTDHFDTFKNELSEKIAKTNAILLRAE